MRAVEDNWMLPSKRSEKKLKRIIGGTQWETTRATLQEESTSKLEGSLDARSGKSISRQTAQEMEKGPVVFSFTLNIGRARPHCMGKLT